MLHNDIEGLTEQTPKTDERKRSLVQRWVKWLCSLLGHKYDPIDIVIVRIKYEAENRKELKNEITCLRCKETMWFAGH